MKANPAQHRERDEEACCLICYEEGPDVFHLGCPGSHTFCGACLTHWLTSGDPGALLDAAANLPHCPSCKQEKGPPGHIPLEVSATAASHSNQRKLRLLWCCPESLSSQATKVADAVLEQLLICVHSLSWQVSTVCSITLPDKRYLVQSCI